MVTNYTYNDLNQLTQAGDVTYTWDNAGNLISQSGVGTTLATYTYDSRNRMISANVNSLQGTITESYAYDYLGNRTSKTSGGVTTVFTTDLSTGYSQVLKATKGTDTVYYTRGFELISRREGTAASYYLYDGGLSVRALTDEDGDITDTLVFDAFGNETGRTGTTDNSYGFQGEEKDATGLYYLRARYMDPSTGTFTSMDTYAGSLSDPVSLHKYLFANANPVMYSDPSGHESVAEEMGVISIIGMLAEAFLETISVVVGFMKNAYVIYTIIALVIVTISAIIISGILNWGHVGVSTTGDIVINQSLPNTISWEDLKEIIIAKAETISFARDYRTDGEWHHIVAKRDPRAIQSRIILRNSGYRSIDPTTNFAKVDIVENLVYLKTAMHRRLHTDEYHLYVFSVLKSVYQENATENVNKVEVAIALNMIRGQLMSMQSEYPQNMTGVG